jgi:hypothetical protein
MIGLTMFYFLIAILSTQSYCNPIFYVQDRSPGLFIQLCKTKDADILSDHNALVEIMNRYSLDSDDDGIDQARYIREISEKYRFDTKESIELYYETCREVTSYERIRIIKIGKEIITEIIDSVIPAVLSYVQEMRDYKLNSKFKIFENLKNQIGELPAKKVEEFFPKSISSFSCFIKDDDSLQTIPNHVLYKIINFKGTLYLLGWKVENMAIYANYIEKILQDHHLIKTYYKNELSDCVDLLNEGGLELPPSVMNILEKNSEGKWQYIADKLY